MLKVKYGNRFVKYKLQVARVMFGSGSTDDVRVWVGPGSTGNIFGLGPGRAELPSGRVG
jgi:hypothetical protein